MAVVLHFFVFLAVFTTSLVSDVTTIALPGNEPLFCAKSVKTLKGWSSTGSNATSSRAPSAGIGKQIAILHYNDTQQLNKDIVKRRITSNTSSTVTEALSIELVKAAKEGDITRIEQLVKYGANLEYRDSHHEYYTVLHHSIASDKGCKVGALKRLLDLGAPIEANDKDGYTPLHIAALNGREECMKVLLNRTANVSATNNIGSTPLHLAVRVDSISSVKLLLTANADPQAREKDGKRPIYHARSKEMNDLLKNYSSIYYL